MITPCVGRSDLFDSTEQAAHDEAKSLCATCPRLAQCTEELQQMRDFRGLEGTWAGYGFRIGARPGSRGRPPAKCGTDGGYHRHRRILHEEPCEPCKDAHRAAEQQRRANRRSEAA